MNQSLMVHDITKQFSGKTVVDHVSFEVMRGEVYGLLGHNGAGKSTTIEMILGLQIPQYGTIKVMGKDPKKNRKELFERIGVQLQSSHYQNHIKVEEICEETAALYQDPANYVKLLEQFQLTHLMKHKVETLSGGEQQKLSLVLALIPKPELLFLDELTTGLDAQARKDVWECLKTCKQQGMTILLTTHYMEEAEYLCDRLMFLRQGKKIVEGTIQEVVTDRGFPTLEDAYLHDMKEEV